MRRFILGLALPGIALLLAGCSGGPRYVPVSGVVTMDGKPLANAIVTFQPVAEGKDEVGGVGSTAKTDAEGRFTLEASTPTPTPGAFVGKHTVRIGSVPSSASTNMDSDAANPPGGVTAPKVVKDPIPEKYNTASDLTFDVPAGGTDAANFELKSK